MTILSAKTNYFIPLHQGRLAFGNHYLPQTLCVQFEDAFLTYATKPPSSHLDQYMHIVKGSLENVRVMLVPSPRYVGMQNDEWVQIRKIWNMLRGGHLIWALLQSCTLPKGCWNWNWFRNISKGSESCCRLAGVYLFRSICRTWRWIFFDLWLQD